jgi:hypothetical protein
VIVLAREVLVCRCSTTVPDALSAATSELGELAQQVTFRRGGEADLENLEPVQRDDPESSQASYLVELRARLARDEWWMLGLAGDRIVTYTWLHTRPRVEYPYLPGCAFDLAPDVGYGHDAWTPTDLRGGGLRRRAFVEELRILRSLGMQWEASFFVKHQLEGAQRSLAKVGIVVEPMWRVRLTTGRKLAVERLSEEAFATPAFEPG